MNVATPYSAVAPTIEGEVLIVLARSSGVMTGRHVATLVKRGSQSAVNQALERLVAQGLVLRESAGRAYLYRLNRDHLAFPAVHALESMRGVLLERLRATLSSWAAESGDGAPVHGSLFGSTARGDGDGDSDIDLFVVRPDATTADDPTWLEHIDQLRAAVASWTGNQASVVEIALTDCATLRTDNPHVVQEMERDGILLAGTPLTELLGAR